MIELINNSINSPRMLSCISRPRRFGKSYAAKMLCAYYDCSCDSRTLFDDEETGMVRIPNEEVRQEFEDILRIGII